LTDDLITGIAEIDNQHKEIFNWGNALIFPMHVIGHEMPFLHTAFLLTRQLPKYRAKMLA